MIANITYLFTQGVLLGWGPCLLFCGMYILPVATFSVSSRKDIFKNLIAFMTGRFIIYVLLGVLSGVIGIWLLHHKLTAFFRWVFLFMLLGMGIYIIFKNQEMECRYKNVMPRNFFVLGILVGLAPCIPLLGILLQILLMSKSVVDSVILSIAFGLGTLLNPLWFILWGVAVIKEKLINQQIIGLLQKVIGLLIIIFVIYNFYKLFFIS